MIDVLMMYNLSACSLFTSVKHCTTITVYYLTVRCHHTDKCLSSGAENFNSDVQTNKKRVPSTLMHTAHKYTHIIRSNLSLITM